MKKIEIKKKESSIFVMMGLIILNKKGVSICVYYILPIGIWEK